MHSNAIKQGPSRAPARAMLRATGLDDAAIAKPLVAVVSTWSDVSPCNITLRDLAQDVRRVEVYRRSEGWEFERTIDSAATPVRLESLGLELTLDAIYEGLELPADPGDSPKPVHGSPGSAG